MARAWSQFPHQRTDGENATMRPWLNATTDCKQSHITLPQLLQTQFVKGCGFNGANGVLDFAALSDIAQAGSSTPNQAAASSSILPPLQDAIDYPQAAAARLSAQARQLSLPPPPALENDILSGIHPISHNCVGTGSKGIGYNDIFSIPDSSKLASSWVVSGGSQDLSPEEKEMIYRAAAMQPINMNPSGSGASGETEVDKPKPRRNVRISKDPQSIAARQRRQRISSKMRVLQKMVPGGMKMDTASMLEEAAQYLKFLQAEVAKMEAIERLMHVAKGHMDCRLAQGGSINGANSIKPKNSMSVIQSGPQSSLLCNPSSSQLPHYLNQASLTI